jgi:hypothetical protein
MKTRPGLRWTALVIGIACVAGATPGPALAQTRPSPAPAPAPTTIHRRRPGLTAAGAVIFGLSYGGALFLSAAMLNSRCCRESMAFDFAIPIIGPVVGGPEPDRNVMILWSGAQLFGAVLLYYGIKGDDVPATRDGPAAGAAGSAPTLLVTPTLARNAGGMALTARW